MPIHSVFFFLWFSVILSQELLEETTCSVGLFVGSVTFFVVSVTRCYVGSSWVITAFNTVRVCVTSLTQLKFKCRPYGTDFFFQHQLHDNWHDGLRVNCRINTESRSRLWVQPSHTCMPTDIKYIGIWHLGDESLFFQQDILAYRLANACPVNAQRSKYKIHTEINHLLAGNVKQRTYLSVFTTILILMIILISSSAPRQCVTALHLR